MFSHSFRWGILLVVAVLIFAGFTVANHIIRDAATSTTIFSSANEDVSRQYNVSVNNSDSLTTANITQVNITLPSGFTFSSGTNLTTSGASFSNTSNTLSWVNSSSVVSNGTVRFFLFNATAANPGNFTFVIVTVNSTGAYNQNNLTIIINDTTPPSSLEFSSPTPSNGSYSSGNVTINATAVDNGVMQNLTILIYNSSYGIAFSSNSSAGENATSANFSISTAGTYYFNVTAFDSFGNRNDSGTRTFIVDTTPPTVSLSQTAATESSISFSISGADSESGITSCSLTTASGGTITLSGNGLTGLSCGNSYSVTSACTNGAGIVGQRSGSFSTNSCGGGGSSSAGSSLGWSRTFPSTGDVRNEPVNVLLGSSERAEILVGGAKHYIGVKSVGPSSALIEITSDPISLSLNVGEEKYVDLDKDGNNDVKIKLVSADYGKVNIHVEMAKEVGSVTGAATKESEKSPVGTNTQKSTQSKGFGAYLALVLIVAIFIAAYFFWRRRKSGKSAVFRVNNKP